MTSNKLFDMINLADDKYLKNLYGDEPQTGVRIKAEKRRSPIKLPAVCAACLAVVVGLTLVIGNINKIDPFFGKPAKGTISKIAEKDLINYSAQSGIDFGNFSYTIDRYQHVTGSDNINVRNQTAVSAEITLSIHIEENGYPTNNVPARLFLLSDGKPVDFKLSGEDGEPGQYKDVTLHNPRHEKHTYYLSDTFNIEFNASSANEQFTAVATFFPDDVFDLQKSVVSRDSSCLTAVKCVRNNLAAVSYDYGDYKPESYSDFYFFGSYVNYIINNDINISGQHDYYDKKYALKENIRCDIYRNKDYQIAYRQYIIMDGKLLDCFGGEYFTLIEPASPSLKQGNTRASFTIPREYVPGSGTHTVQTFQEPIIPASVKGGAPGHVNNAVTFTCGETLKDLEREAQKFEPEEFTWYNDRYAVPVRVRVQTDSNVFKKGSKIKLKVTIRNYDVSDAEPIMLYSPGSSAGVSMYISRDGGGELINTDGYYLRGVTEEEPTVIELNPGEEYNVEFNFDAMIEKDGVKIKAPEGLYRGYLIFQFRESRDNGNGHTYTYLTNRTVNFKFYI